MPKIPEHEKRPASLTIWTVGREGGQIVCKPCVMTGPVRFGSSVHELPPELLERLIAIPDEEDESCP